MIGSSVFEFSSFIRTLMRARCNGRSLEPVLDKSMLLKYVSGMLNKRPCCWSLFDSDGLVGQHEQRTNQIFILSVINYISLLS